MNAHSESSQQQYVTAEVIAKRYNVTARYILQLAAAGRIPSLRLGRKCVRFAEAEVVAVLETGMSGHANTTH